MSEMMDRESSKISEISSLGNINVIRPKKISFKISYDFKHVSKSVCTNRRLFN